MMSTTALDPWQVLCASFDPRAGRAAVHHFISVCTSAGRTRNADHVRLDHLSRVAGHP